MKRVLTRLRAVMHNTTLDDLLMIGLNLTSDEWSPTNGFFAEATGLYLSASKPAPLDYSRAHQHHIVLNGGKREVCETVKGCWNCQRILKGWSPCVRVSTVTPGQRRSPILWVFSSPWVFRFPQGRLGSHGLHRTSLLPLPVCLSLLLLSLCMSDHPGVSKAYAQWTQADYKSVAEVLPGEGYKTFLIRQCTLRGARGHQNWTVARLRAWAQRQDEIAH